MSPQPYIDPTPEPLKNPMKAMDNKWLIVKQNVILTSVIEPVICLLDPWFERFNTRSFVSSGLRNPEDQFRIIKNFALKNGIDTEFPEIRTAMLDTKIDGVPVWLGVWSRELAIGLLVNPPEDAMTLFEYISPKTGKTVPAGTLIKASSHFTGRAFDIEGSGGNDPTLKDEHIVILAAVKSGDFPQIISETVEVRNNCIHIDCRG